MLKMDRPHLHALMASCPRQAGQTEALVKSPDKRGSIEGLSAHKQTPPTCSPRGPTPPPSPSDWVKAAGVAQVTRTSLGGQEVGADSWSECLGLHRHI